MGACHIHKGHQELCAQLCLCLLVQKETRVEAAVLDRAGMAHRQCFSPGPLGLLGWGGTFGGLQELAQHRQKPSCARWVCEVLLCHGTRFPHCCLLALCGLEFGRGIWALQLRQSSDPAVRSSPPAQSTLMTSPQTEEFFDLIASSQSRRLDDQRANVGNLPGLRITHNNLGHLRVEGDAQEPGDEFFNMLMKCQVWEFFNMLRECQVRARGWGSSATSAPAPSSRQGCPAANAPLSLPCSPPGSRTSAVPPLTPSPVAPPCLMKISSASSSVSRPSAWTSSVWIWPHSMRGLRRSSRGLVPAKNWALLWGGCFSFILFFKGKTE